MNKITPDIIRSTPGMVIPKIKAKLVLFSIIDPPTTLIEELPILIPAISLFMDKVFSKPSYYWVDSGVPDWPYGATFPDKIMDPNVIEIIVTE